MTESTSQMIKLRQTLLSSHPTEWLESYFPIVLDLMCVDSWEAAVWSRLLLSCSSALSLKCEMWSRRAASTYQDLADETKSPTIWALTSLLSLSARKHERRTAFELHLLASVALATGWTLAVLWHSKRTKIPWKKEKQQINTIWRVESQMFENEIPLIN